MTSRRRASQHRTTQPMTERDDDQRQPLEQTSALAPSVRRVSTMYVNVLPQESGHQSSFHGLFAKIASAGHSARRGMSSAAMIVSAMSMS